MKMIPTEQFIPDLTHSSLEGLAYILRHKNLWPKNFSWEFSDCERCAIGLATKIWPGSYSNYMDMIRHFDLEPASAFCIFIKGTSPEVTPESVAHRIEKYLGFSCH